MRKVLILIYKILVKFFGGRNLGKFYPVKKITLLLKSNVVEVNGHKMFLDKEDTLSLSLFGSYERFVTKTAEKEIKGGDVVIDIGAHIGYYTLVFARLAGEKGKVFAFEPDQTNTALIEKNVKINNYKNVTIVQKAVSNKTGKIMLYLSGSNDHRIYDSHDGRKTIEIDSIKLDDYFKNYSGKIDFIKMDIQGAEGMALQGMKNILKRNRNIKIITEFSPSALEKSGTDPKNFLKSLLKLGLKIYNINDQEKEKKVEIIPVQELLDRYSVGKDNQTNLLCIKEK